jgi:isochorismate hydrolase
VSGMYVCIPLFSSYLHYFLQSHVSFIVSCGVRDRIEEYHLSLSSMNVVKGTKGLIALTSEIYCDQTAIGDRRSAHS